MFHWLFIISVSAVLSQPTLRPWDNAFTMTQWQYSGVNLNDSSGSYYFDKQMSYMFYDYNKLSYRNDYHSVRGAVRVNSSSIWVNDTLYIIDFLTAPFECQVLDMGFGMPRPDWFVDATFHEYIYLMDVRDDDVKRSYHFSKESPDGPFHYFAEDPNQVPFRLSAPVITEYNHVVNNWYDYRAYDDLDDAYFDYYKEVCSQSKSKKLMENQENQQLAQTAVGFMYNAALYFKQ
mmetsp:Transcript_34479/g.55321  ORF Transcript_34479/g.55321 Transcript_34479/m.55321 type:complete len:233 (-) Transcript_34479:180-878(-)